LLDNEHCENGLTIKTIFEKPELWNLKLRHGQAGLR
jgi:hypothetical protein